VNKVKGLSDNKTFSIQEKAEFLKNLFIPEQVILRRNRGKYFAVFLYAVGTEKGSIISGPLLAVGTEQDTLGACSRDLLHTQRQTECEFEFGLMCEV
jgi:hypothetical protein